MSSQSFFKTALKITLASMMMLCLVGCHSKNNENIYKVKEDATIDEYLMLSNQGIDYFIPRLDSQYWNEFRNIKNETKVAKSKNKEATFYIIRAEDIGDGKEFKTTLDEASLKKILNKEAEIYVGELNEKRNSINYEKDIKYFDAKGTIADKYYYASYFQSNCEIPSVSIRYVPTLYVIVYENQNDEDDIIDMVKTIKEWTFRLD